MNTVGKLVIVLLLIGGTTTGAINWQIMSRLFTDVVSAALGKNTQEQLPLPTNQQYILQGERERMP